MLRRRKTAFRTELFSPRMNPDDLAEALRHRLPRAKRHRWLALAQPRTPTERAWLLIALGVALRYGYEYDEALKALAAAVHRDRGDYDAARRISRSMPE